MGPLAGIGDSLIWGTLRIIAAGIAISFSKDGNIMGPLIFLNEKSKFTLQMGIRYFQQMFGTEYTLIMASTTMSLIPILLIYMLAQKYFIEGIAASGIKG